MRILCIKTTALPAEWVKESRALAVDFFEKVKDEDAEWIERADAEQDESYKQIIPYIVLENPGGELLCYQRHGTEARLRGLYSCGTGGHIDWTDRRETLPLTIKAGIARELSEELENYNAGSLLLEYLGIINDTEQPVSRVHLGLVYRARCADGYVPRCGEELSGASWLSPAALSALEKEAWTRLALRLLPGI
ncbi:MAG: NUDIX domain-containing protein [Spirochaetaceae bacterium]|jgi:predicted NUDIX family phosphoesterase|nr:NUDIX domain-containing protein [Spirochaetaceae bacterium]